jgi:hypothetical protein
MDYNMALFEEWAATTTGMIHMGGGRYQEIMKHRPKIDGREPKVFYIPYPEFSYGNSAKYQNASLFPNQVSPAYPTAPSNAWLFPDNNVTHNALIPGLNPNVNIVNIVNTPPQYIGPYQPRSDEQMSLMIGQGVVEGLTWEMPGAIIAKGAVVIADATRLSSFSKTLFLSERLGITSELFGSSVAKAQGAWNKPGVFKIGWSTAKNSGMQMRIGLGQSAANSNNALIHIPIPGTFVPNSFANPSIGVKLSIFKLSTKTGF